MSFAEQLKWSLRHTKRQMLESILVILAIGLGIGVIITVMAVFLSLAEDYREIGKGDWLRTLEVVRKADSGVWQWAPITVVGPDTEEPPWEATLEDVLLFAEQLPSTMYTYVQEYWVGQTNLLPVEEDEDEFYFPSNSVYVAGVLPAYLDFKGARMGRGSLFTVDDVRKGSPVLVLTDILARDLFGNADPIGQAVPLGTQEGGTIEFTVIGVLAPPSEEEKDTLFEDSRIAWAPVTAIPSLTGASQGTFAFNNISVGIDQGVNLASAVEIVRSQAELIWGEDTVGVRNPLDAWRESMRHIQRFAALIGLLASVGLVIAVINILNLMMARVIKRTKPIGLSMALGSSRRMVFRQFMMEAVFLGMAGAVVGIVLSFGFAELFERGYGYLYGTAKASARMALGIAMGFVVSFLFGVYPAYLGSRVNPVDALRVE